MRNYKKEKIISWTSKTLFEGLFPLPSWKAKQGIKKHKDIYCFYEDKIMIIKEMDIEKKKVKESLMYEDKNNLNKGKQYNLWYYLWTPKTQEEITKQILGY